jgi:superfamily II DNA or RNA helicase
MLSNRWAVFSCSPEIQIRLREILSFEHPNRNFIVSFRDGQWDGHVSFFQRSRCSSGLFLEKREEIEKEFSLQITDVRIPLKFHEIQDEKSREYQNESVDAMIQASRTGGLLINSTGSGKTRIAGIFFKRLEGTACFIVDELTLLEQTRRAFMEVLEEPVGVVGHSEFHPKRITVATIQTLHKHRHRPEFKRWFPKIDVLVIDEVHIALNKRNLDVIQQIRPKAVFGLTATLQIEKPEIRIPATALCGPVIYSYPIREGVAEGYLSKGRIICLQFPDPLKGVAPGYWSVSGKEKLWIPPGSPAAQYRYHICLNKQRNDCIEALVREGLKQGRKIIVLVEHKVHLAVLDQRLKDVNHYSLSGEVNTEVRLQAMRDMDEGKCNLILASRVFSHGVDIKKVNMLLDCTGAPSRNAAIQRYGRGVRLSSDKVLLYIDVSDVGNKFEFSARLRKKALMETGAPITNCFWEGDASVVFKEFL